MGEIYFDIHSRLASFGLDVLETLHERVLDDATAIKTDELRQMLTMALDRIGHGPKSTVQQNIGVTIFSDEALERVKQEAARRSSSVVRSLPSAERTIDCIPVRAAEESRAEKSEGEQGLGTLLRAEIHPDAPSGSADPALLPPVDQV